MKLYHATFSKLLKKIKKVGYLGNSPYKMWSDSDNRYVYLATDPDEAYSYAETALDEIDNEKLYDMLEDDEIVVLETDTKYLDKNKLFKDKNVIDGETTYQYEGIINCQCLRIFDMNRYNNEIEECLRIAGVKLTEREDLTKFNRIAGFYHLDTKQFELFPRTSEDISTEDDEINDYIHNVHSKDEFTEFHIVRFGIEDIPGEGVVCYIEADTKRHAEECYYAIIDEYAEDLDIIKYELEYYIGNRQKMIFYDRYGNQIMESLNESYGRMDRLFIWNDPTYSQFHRILRDNTTYGKLSAIIDNGHIYCWDSALSHHDSVVKDIEESGIKLSDDYIWVRFKEPNLCWVSAAYFDDYTDDDLEDLPQQDFEKELEENPIIKKYFPQGVKVVRFDSINESIIYVSKKDLSDIILLNPTRKELKDNNINLARYCYDEEGNFYFGNANIFTHNDIISIIENKLGITLYDDIGFYNTNNNCFYIKGYFADEDEYNEELESAKRKFSSESLLKDLFGNFKVDIFQGEIPEKNNNIYKLNESDGDKILYLVRGLPGSGKSTLAKTLTKNVVEADQFLYDENGEYVWTQERVIRAHRLCQETVKKYMEEGRNKIAVANTFIKLRDMKPYKKLAEEYGYKVIVKSRSENKYIDYLDNKNYKSIHNMSDERMDSMRSRFQQNDEPVSFVAYHGGVEPDMTPDENRPLYLCSTYKLAKSFAKREVYNDGLYEDEIPTVFTFEGTFKHPYYLTDNEYDAGGQDSNIDYQWFKENGYDGIVMEADKADTYYIVIDLSTIKLVNKEVFKTKWNEQKGRYEIAENENNIKYYFIGKCNDTDDGMEIQDITHWDEWGNSEYYGIPEDDESIEVIDTNAFLKMIGNQPRPKKIEYCAKNKDKDIIWAYDDEGIHWFYSQSGNELFESAENDKTLRDYALKLTNICLDALVKTKYETRISNKQIQINVDKAFKKAVPMLKNSPYEYFIILVSKNDELNASYGKTVDRKYGLITLPVFSKDPIDQALSILFKHKSMLNKLYSTYSGNELNLKINEYAIKYLKKELEKSLSNVRSEYIDILIHECTHLLDDVRRTKTYKSKEQNLKDDSGIEDYYNSPEEQNAFYQETISIFDEWANQTVGYKTFDIFWDDFVRQYKGEYNMLNDKNKRKLKKRAYAYWNVYMRV